MAEFKLGRIRFIWKGDWSASTVYYKDDIVRNGGNVYVALSGHTSSVDFANDQSIHWNKMSDGQDWKSDWLVNTYYKINDVVKYGGYLYIANTAHTSAATVTLGLEDDQAKWDLYGEGFDWNGDWSETARYKINDIVKYNGITYICIEGHTSASSSLGLENDQSKWQVFSEGFEWLGNWATEQRYRKNDIIKYGGQLYVANTGHTSAATETLGLEADQSKWDYFHKGIEYKGTWATSIRYKVNDLVKWGGGIWIANTHHTSTTSLAADESNWAQFVEGLEFEDNWSAYERYQPGDIVTYGGYSYVAVTNNIALKPSDNTSDWDVLNTGWRFIGDYDDDSTNREYIEGDVVRLGGFTYLCIDKHTGQRPPNTDYWERLNSGIEWKGAWADATFYDAGDAVRYGDNSYIAIVAHDSDETVAQNRPDQDVDGSEWNLLSGGVETNVLTTRGDIVYYGGAGPARLPIGDSGQVLKVNNAGTDPQWSFLGSINNVYYVETNNGQDTPAPTYGTTLDQPFKTIQYAAQQIENGALRPNAKYLIETNNAFVMDETVEWVDAQVTANAGTPFTNTFTYDKAAWEIYSGRLVSAIMYDITHGGNQKVRNLTLDIFDNTDIVGKEAEFNAAMTYTVDLIDAVISNVAPAATYGTFSQTTNVSYSEETDAQTTIDNLLVILTDAVTAGVNTGVPAERIANNTIFVKTGEFSEVLPIVVPHNTAVVGDELRSTRIVPAGSLVSSSDTPYSLAGILNLESNLNALLSGDNDGPGLSDGLSSFSGESVDSTLTVADSAVALEVAELARQIHDYIDFGVNGASGDSTIPTKYGSNVLTTTIENTYAAEVIEKNRTYLVEEVIGYIAATYPSYSYNADKCRRDVNKYIDAIKHDLLYSTNYRSLRAAEQYVNAVNGSITKDMFYMRNGTGLRNCTVSGLTGTLSSDNAFGTKRPTAGAFVSLDPGWGPAHTDAWITNKSPYVQNVTTFGTGCIGCKIDGDLHDGGNDSIVANDFTQVVSDGIGVWCTNLGRTELVSVFSYYGHIGYLAENGGKIRATNGNSSYGTFGTVAEGTDVTEVATTGQVTNRSFEAVIDSVLTDGDDILIFEYLNAGQDYTAGGTTFTVTGEGFGASINTPVVNNGAVFEVRMLNPSDNLGGKDYITGTNAAQGGNATSITVSNTDIRTSGQYIGMAVYITSGVGVGQYGYIDSYNSGTKIASIYKMSDGTPGWDHVTGQAVETTLDGTTTYVIEPRVTFTAPPSGLYADTAKGRAYVEAGQISKVTLWDTGSGYTSAPTLTFVDPNNTVDAPIQVRIADGVLTQPTWTDRGTGFVTAEAEVTGDGFMDRYQPGELIQVVNLTEEPKAGANVEFDHLPGQFFRLVVVRDLGGVGPFSAQLQVSPKLPITDAPEHNEDLSFTLRYSQVRLTGHDFLDIGTGNFANTNYPGVPLIDPIPDNETIDSGGGRVFYTSTDQDGNFRVGELFSVEQATGVATLNADAFNISGLQELSLGELGLGGTGATITEFSTDGTFTANSDNIVPTQKAIKTYITSQIGGGAATLNVNSITAGQIQISTNTIEHVGDTQINVEQKMNFKRGVDGHPVALNYFLTQ
jgi:hypothetical protein